MNMINIEPVQAITDEDIAQLDGMYRGNPAQFHVFVDARLIWAHVGSAAS